jgi:NADH dehydrogenase/NADH:ubiquinone oxidoreductase subunit G
MKQIRLTINGQAVSGQAGQTLLQVANQHAIAIPTLCNFPGLAPAGSCRVCIVEIAGYPRPLPACATPARTGDGGQHLCGADPECTPDDR